MSTVAVKPELIRWAIHRSGLPVSQFEKAFPKLEGWQRGEAQPTLNQLERFAKMTMAPFGALFLERPPKEELSLPDFRTQNDTPLTRCSPNLLDTIQQMQSRQEWMREWLIQEGAEELEFVGTATTDMDVEDVAKIIRKKLKLSPDWSEQDKDWEHAFQTLRRAIESAGICVFSNSVVGLNNRRPLNPNEFRGFVISDPIAPLIFINDADAKSARMFTLAHEVVHVWLGESGVCNLEGLLLPAKRIEKFCNQVAAEFLVPAKKIALQWSRVKDNVDPYQSIAKTFKVSPLVVARRALDLQLITKSIFVEFYKRDRKHWQRVKDSQSGGGNFYATQNSRMDKRYAAAVVRAAREGRILYQEAFRLTGLKGQTFQEFANRVLTRVRDEHK